MKRLKSIFRLATALTFVTTQAINAQAVASLQGAVSPAANQLSARVSLNLKSVTLRSAIDAIKSQSSVKVSYRRETVDKKPLVTVKADNITVSDAFTKILAGTGLQLVTLPSGQLAIMELDAQGKSAQGVVSGKITDAKNGKEVLGATVSVNSGSRGVTTGEDGRYRIIGVASGVHTITVRLVGYAKQTRSVSVSDGATVTADFRLEPSANVLDQIVVTGTAVATEIKAVPNAITVITSKQIEERGITRIDQLFRGDIPGLFALNSGSNAQLNQVTMYSRGASAINGRSPNTDMYTANTSPIKTYVDGIELVDSKYLSQIDPSSIERIEIISGPQASTIYGANALNGVMQIFTKRGKTSRPQITLNLSSGVAQNNFNSHLTPSHLAEASAAGIEGRVNYSAGASWDYAGAWTPGKQTQRISTYGGTRIESRLFTADISARSGLTKNQSKGALAQAVTNLEAIGGYISTATATRPKPTTSTVNGKTLGLTLNYRPLAWWSHELVFGKDQSDFTELVFERGFSYPGNDTTLSAYMSKSAGASERYTNTLQIPVSSLANMNLVAGAEHFRTTGSSWSAAPQSLTGSLANASVIRNAPRKRSGAFAQGQIAIRDMIFLTYGMRAEWDKAFGENARVLPGRYGLSMVSDVGSVSIKLRGSYGRAVRPPAYGLTDSLIQKDSFFLEELGPYNDVIANPDLLPEHQKGGEGGVELYFASRGSLVITRYNQTVDNLIDFVRGVDSVRSLKTTPSLCSSRFREPDGHCYWYQAQYLNAASIRNQGWEMQGSLNMGPLVTRGTYSWTKSRILGVTPRYAALLNTVSYQVGRPLGYVPEHTWALGTTYSRASTSIALAINGTGMLYSGLGPPLLALNNNVRLKITRPRETVIPTIFRYANSGYATADINLAHRFLPNVDATLQINNLTDYYRNDYNSNFATLGRQTKAGIKIRM